MLLRFVYTYSVSSTVVSQCFQASAHLKALSLQGVLIEDACQEHSAVRTIVYACRLSSINCGFLEILEMGRSALLTSDAKRAFALVQFFLV
jgi:hypothetical protein